MNDADREFFRHHFRVAQGIRCEILHNFIEIKGLLNALLKEVQK